MLAPQPGMALFSLSDLGFSPGLALTFSNLQPRTMGSCTGLGGGGQRFGLEICEKGIIVGLRLSQP